ncbi:hypothetical protein [Bernardetia sp.]|uniref:hypothetical protein n=1 Tax=Bernardetia sp. TaxID=1937974 RepID=UPI0025C6AD5A|nr:hypothetical protein [Bernardetia sp.]
MKFQFNFWLLIAFFAVFGISACGSDDEPTDPRDEVIGTYNYSVEVTEIDLGRITDLDESGTLIVSKNGSDKLDFKEGGELLFTAEKIRNASNGIVFDIAPQTQNIGNGVSVTIEGYDVAELDNTLYNGRYVSGSKKIFTGFTFRTVIDNLNYQFFYKFEGTKQ